jgi:HEAT repeat protein
MYVASWGPHYGSRWAPYIGGDKSAKVNWGRVFRIRHSERPLTPRKKWDTAKRSQPYEQWSAKQLIADLGAQLRVWRTDAQLELVRRGESAKPALLDALKRNDLSKMAETYAVWALGRIGPDVDRFAQWAAGDEGAGLNRRIQAIRVIGDRGLAEATQAVAAQLDADPPRVRFAAAQALRHLKAKDHRPALLRAIADESDRLCFHAQWLALRAIATPKQLRSILRDSDGVNVQGAALLALEPGAKVDREAIERGGEDEGLEAARQAIEQAGQ